MNHNRGKIFLFILLLLTVILSSSGQEFSRGAVIAKVVTLENKEQSYALYLPLNYSADKKWPALYIFDPEGEGAPPANIFQKAAEKYGFIVIGSNNNRNGLGSEKQSEFIKGLWKDTHARFAIDERRTYVAGYSGGARLANNFAYSCKGCIAGVIACGASFPPEFPLDKDLPYAIFGTAGTNDFNYPEMIKLDRTLSKLGVPHHTATFDGVHQWLTEALAIDAIEWFNLQAMKNGRLEKDDAFIKAITEKREARAENFLKSGQILEAYNEYDSLARETAITKNRDRIAKEKSYKDMLKLEKELFERQNETVRKVIAMAGDLLDPELKINAARMIAAELGKLRTLSEIKTDSGERRFARRTLRALLAESNESAMYIYMQKKDYKSAAANFELASLVYPSSPYIEINLARALVLDGRKNEAVIALNRALEKGFKDCATLAKDEAFSGLQTNKDYLKLKAAMNCNN